MSEAQKKEQTNQNQSGESKKEETSQKPQPIKFKKTIRMNNDSSDD